MVFKALALTGLIAACTPQAIAAGPNSAATSAERTMAITFTDAYAKQFVLVTEANYSQLAARVSGAGIRRVQSVRSGSDALVLLEMRRSQWATLRAVLSDKSPHGGAVAFATQDEALAYAKTAAQGVVAPGDGYSLSEGKVVRQWLPRVDESALWNTISYLSTSFRSRAPSSPDGKKAAEGIKARWEALVPAHKGARVELVDCNACGGQPSVVMTITGFGEARGVVVLGAHLDSPQGSDGRSPGANENASGVAVLTETIRIALASDWIPQRDVVIVAYAAQTTGMNGSKALAQSFKSQGRVVHAVLDLDYTNYREPSAAAMRMVSDNTYSALNAFVQKLAATYVPDAPLAANPCGFICGDHASWTAAGFPAASLTGSTWLASNGTARDTLAELGNTAAPSVPFTQMALAFLAETAKAYYPDAPPPQVAAFSYKLDGLTARFTDESKDGADPIYRWEWQFGDGETSKERHPVHVYAKAGSYEVTLHVEGGRSQDNLTKPIVVEEAPVDGVLTNGKVFKGLSGAAGSQRYWTMTVPAGAAYLKFTIGDGSGDADLYVKRGSKPTTSSFDCRPYQIGNEEVCVIERGEGGTYHVMLRGYKAYAGLWLGGKYQVLPERKTYTNENGMAVPDNGGAIESKVVVAGREGNADSASSVQVDIKHTYIGDLVVELVAPDETVYVLHNRSGGSKDNISATYNVDLSRQRLNGTWKLRVRDLSRGDVGELDRWSLTF